MLKKYHGALADLFWYVAMVEEFNALATNQTWDLVPPPNSNVISSKWVYQNLYNSDGSLARYKAHSALRGFSQQPSIDYDETFNLFIKSATIKTAIDLCTNSI
jgi:hypothetical protein